jgi:hypothetical protein
LLPIVPFLAATVNYDNLLFPLTALALLLGLRLAERLKGSRTFDLKTALQLIAVCCLASLVQYSFLPIFVGIVLFFGGYLLRISRRGKPRILFQVSKIGGILVIVFALLGTGLFVERYGYNTLRYHTPLPQCNKVLSVEACSAYLPWQRNYQLAQTNVSHRSLWQMARFDRAWVHMLAGGVFTVVATQGGAPQPAIPYVMVSGLIIIAIGTLFALLFWRRWLMHKVPLILLATVTACYLGALWLQNYADFSHLGLPIGVQARYLVPVLPLLLIVPCMGFTLAFRERQHLSFAVASMAMLVLLVGGGVMTYVARSNTNWYWHNQVIVRANANIRHVLEHTLVAELPAKPQ